LRNIGPLDHLIRAGEHGWRNGETKRPCGPEIDDQPVPRGQLGRRLRRLGARRTRSASSVTLAGAVAVGLTAASPDVVVTLGRALVY
jgi:hypothetical protein